MSVLSSTQISPRFVDFWSSIAAPHGNQDPLIARGGTTSENGERHSRTQQKMENLPSFHIFPMTRDPGIEVPWIPWARKW